LVRAIRSVQRAEPIRWLVPDATIIPIIISGAVGAAPGRAPG